MNINFLKILTFLIDMYFLIDMHEKTLNIKYQSCFETEEVLLNFWYLLCMRRSRAQIKFLGKIWKIVNVDYLRSGCDL